MDVDCVVIELLPNSRHAVDDWAQYLNEHREAALETLAQEGVTLESWFRISLEGKDYLIAMMRAEDLEIAREVVQQSLSHVDERHRAFKKATWGARFKAELLVDLSRLP